MCKQTQDPGVVLATTLKSVSIPQKMGAISLTVLLMNFQAAGYGVWWCESLRNEVVMFLESSQCWQNVDIKDFVPHRDLS